MIFLELSSKRIVLSRWCVKTEEKVRTMIDAADLRFESQRERLRSNQDAEMKDLEDKLMDKLQRALDNPLAD